MPFTQETTELDEAMTAIKDAMIKDIFDDMISDLEVSDVIHELSPSSNVN